MELYTAGYLENGLGFLLAPRLGAHLTHLALYLDHGVKDETPEENGISHLLEHLLFNVSSFQGRLKKLWEDLAQQGSQFGAWTGKEHTRFTLSVPPKSMGDALEFLSELVRNPSIRKAALEHERKIVLDELERKKSRPEYLINLLEEALFAPPYGLSILGKAEVVSSLNEAALRRKLKSFLHPERARLVIAGRILDTCTQQIQQHFEAWQSTASSQPTTVSLTLAPQFLALPRPGTRVGLYLGFPAPALTDVDRPAVEVLGQLLGGGLRSRVFKRVREQDGLAYAVGGNSVHWRWSGYIFIGAELARDKLLEGYQSLLRSLEELRQNLPETREVSEATQALSIARLTEAESGGLAQRLGMHWMSGELYFPARAAEHYQNINAEAVARASSYLDPQRMALLGVGTTEDEMSRLLEVSL